MTLKIYRLFRSRAIGYTILTTRKKFAGPKSFGVAKNSPVVEGCCCSAAAVAVLDKREFVLECSC